MSVCVCVYAFCLVQYLVENKNSTKSRHHPPIACHGARAQICPSSELPTMYMGMHVLTCTHVYMCVYSCAHVSLSCVYSCAHVSLSCVYSLHTCPCHVCTRVHMCPCHVCTRVHMCPCQGEHSRSCAHISLPLPSLTQAGGGISHVVPSQIPRHHS